MKPKKILFRSVWWIITLGWIIYLSAYIVRPSMMDLADKMILILWGVSIPYLAYLIEVEILDTFD